MKFKPLGDRVLVKPIEADEVAENGIIIPDSAREKPLEGEVVAQIGRASCRERV